MDGSVKDLMSILNADECGKLVLLQICPRKYIFLSFLWTLFSCSILKLSFDSHLAVPPYTDLRDTDTFMETIEKLTAFFRTTAPYSISVSLNRLNSDADKSLD